MENAEFELAARYVCLTDKPVFVTGKAGTGKTTFLKHIRAHCTKKMAVAAPTGVAAINAGGVTLHSLFQLPFGTFLPEAKQEWGQNALEVHNPHSLLSNLRLNAVKRTLIKEMELLIIDEVSMLRADMLDATDTVLRHVRERRDEVFGGVQVLFIGDLYQLPPVVSREDWQLMSGTYDSPFFFDAQALRQLQPVTIELKTIYRQSDADFIEVLNAVRNNKILPRHLEQLHQRHLPDFPPGAEYIMLSSHNAKADAVNRGEMDKLPARHHVFEAVVKGDFSEKSFPADRSLLLKEGAQVMFIKNDKGDNRRYYNGKIVTVARIALGKVYVRLDDGSELELEKETWRNVQFKYDAEKDEVAEEELGSFTQFPLRAAWAITIHKSQGLTFEKAIVDAGAAFAPGQVYVALSRLTSLAGLVLHTRINPAQIMTDERVLRFSDSFLPTDVLQQQLREEEKLFLAKSLSNNFDFEKTTELFKEDYQQIAKSSIPEKENVLPAALERLNECVRMQAVALKFQGQMRRMMHESEQAAYAAMPERIAAAANYFLPFLKKAAAALEAHIALYAPKPRTKKHIAQAKSVLQHLKRKIYDIDQSVFLANALNSDADLNNIWAASEKGRKALSETENEQQAEKEKIPSRDISFRLFKNGSTAEEIAETRSMAVSTIEGHLAHFVGTGELDVSALVPSACLSAVLKKLQQEPNLGASELKAILPDEISFGQIRAAMAYAQRLKTEA